MHSYDCELYSGESLYGGTGRITATRWTCKGPITGFPQKFKCKIQGQFKDISRTNDQNSRTIY